MSAQRPLTGLMNPSETDALGQFKKEIYAEKKPYQTLASRIGELSADERADLIRIAKLVLSFQRATVSASDGNSDSDTTLVQITVIEVDDPPVGYADTLYVNEDEILVLDAAEGVLVNDVDVDGDILTAELAKDVDKGTLDFYSDGSLTYTPDQDYFGTDTFKYFAKDEANVTDHTDVIIIINPVNDKPVLVDDNYVLASGDSLVVSVDSLGVLGNDSDVDGDTLEAQINDQPTKGSVTLGTDGDDQNSDAFGEQISESFYFHYNLIISHFIIRSFSLFIPEIKIF